MTYFEDMSPYGYGGTAPGVVHVGWLEKGREFARATPERELVQALYRRCFAAVERYRGYHVCEWCGELVIVERGERRVCLGNGEMRVGMYAAPTLAAHYVAKHDYRPPDGFVDAVKQLGGDGDAREMTFPQLFERRLAAIDERAITEALREAASSPEAFHRALAEGSMLQRILSHEAGRIAWQELVAARLDPSSIDH